MFPDKRAAPLSALLTWNQQACLSALSGTCTKKRKLWSGNWLMRTLKSKKAIGHQRTHRHNFPLFPLHPHSLSAPLLLSLWCSCHCSFCLAKIKKSSLVHFKGALACESEIVLSVQAFCVYVWFPFKRPRHSSGQTKPHRWNVFWV